MGKIPGKFPYVHDRQPLCRGSDNQFGCVDRIRDTLVGTQPQEKGIHSRLRCVDKVYVKLGV